MKRFKDGRSFLKGRQIHSCQNKENRTIWPDFYPMDEIDVPQNLPDISMSRLILIATPMFLTTIRKQGCQGRRKRKAHGRNWPPPSGWQPRCRLSCFVPTFVPAMRTLLSIKFVISSFETHQWISFKGLMKKVSYERTTSLFSSFQVDYFFLEFEIETSHLCRKRIVWFKDKAYEQGHC